MRLAARLPNNPAVRFETVGDKKELVLSPLDKSEEPASLVCSGRRSLPGYQKSICRKSCWR